MKKDIAVIREAIQKVVNLLTNRSIKVTQRGSQAYVEYARNGRILRVNLPYLPDDASDGFIAAVQGFLDHEVGHVLYTDQKVVASLKKHSAKVKNIANVVEDIYVERRMSKAFSGSVANLDAVRRFYLDTVAKPRIDEALASGDMKAAMGYAGLVQFRAWGGQQIATQFLCDNPAYSKLTQQLAHRMGADLIARLRTVGSSKECLDLAMDIAEKLNEADEARPTPPPDEQPETGKDDADKPEGADTASDAPAEDPHGDDSPGTDDDDDKPEPDDPGTVRTETDDSGKQREERSQTPQDTRPEVGNGQGSEDADREDGSPDDAPAQTGSADEDMADDDADAADAGGDDAGGDDTGTDDVDRAERAAHDGERAETAVAEVFDNECDFDKDVGKTLSSLAREELDAAAYQVFSTDWDEIAVPAPKAHHETSVVKMVDATRHMVAGIQKGLERALAAKARRTWNPGQRRGRIAPGALFKTAVGDDRVFRQRYETRARNTAVSLLVDCSGSMAWGAKIRVAGMAAFALSSTLERLKIAHEVIGFTTHASAAMTTAIKAEGSGICYARSEALYMPLFKGFSERLNPAAQSRLAHLTEGECTEWLRENVDGECLQIAARRLKQQPAERHLLIVLSDGSPACPGNRRQLERHLMQAARKLDEDAGIEVVGIGIMDASVEKYYRKHVVLGNIQDLPTVVVDELAKVLLTA